ncbi:MAG: DUF1803 domain-containing protein [Streptococcaceae bacterium]|nr:DUF1803 domain-containing protein [Streptococcaceae bacterium]
MAIHVYNEEKLTRSAFFKELINSLENCQLTLREIHRTFPEVENLDRKLGAFIDAGFIVRADKRYHLGFEVLDFEPVTTRELPRRNVFTRPFFVSADSSLERALNASISYQMLGELHEISRYDRTTPTLTNYFYKVARDLPLSDFERSIYALIGDVEPAYALRFISAQLVSPPRRKDIFTEVIKRYQLTSDALADPKIPTVSYDNAKDFISHQLRQIP